VAAGATKRDSLHPGQSHSGQAADYALVKFEGRSGQIAVRGVVMHCCAGDTTEGPWATPTTGSGGSRSSRAGRTGTGVWQGRTADVSIRCTSWPAAIALPGRQGRSSRLAPGRDPGPPGYISGAPRRRCAGALPGRLPGRGCERLGCARGLAPLDDRHQRGELVTARGRIQEDGRFFSPNAPGRQEDGLSTQPGLQLTPAARWRHGSGMTASPAATASGGSRRRPIWRCGPGGVTGWPAASGAVLDGCG
jgi:hypothetical protein